MVTTVWTKKGKETSEFPMYVPVTQMGDWFSAGGWFDTGFFVGVGTAGIWSGEGEPPTTWSDKAKDTTSWTKQTKAPSNWT